MLLHHPYGQDLLCLGREVQFFKEKILKSHKAVSNKYTLTSSDSLLKTADLEGLKKAQNTN